MYTKKCAVCGKEITVPNQNYKYCGTECAWKALQMKNAERYSRIKQDEAGYAEYRKRLREYRHKAPFVSVCRICGKPIEQKVDEENYVRRCTMHEECIVNHCVELIKNGKLTHMWRQRMYSRGYDMNMMRHIIATGENPWK